MAPSPLRSQQECLVLSRGHPLYEGQGKNTSLVEKESPTVMYYYLMRLY